MMERGGYGADGTATRRVQAADMTRRKVERATPPQFFREVREEMRQVAWLTRPEVRNFTGIVLFVLIFMTSLIFGLGYGFSKFVTFLFHK